MYLSTYNVFIFAGRQFDKNGHAVDWWMQKTIDKYERLAQCFVDQYNSYLVPSLEDSNIHVRSTKITYSPNFSIERLF